MINHIELQVIKEDVENFYVDIFNFKITKTFLLSNENTTNIFSINESPTIIYGTCCDFELELFVSKSNVKKHFPIYVYKPKNLKK